MTLARHWAPLAAFVLPAGAWVALNQWAASDSATNAAAAQLALHNHMQALRPTMVIPPIDPAWYADTFARHLAVFWPGALLLVGAALLSIVMRSRLRGATFVLAAAALFAGTTAFALNAYVLFAAAGQGIGGDVFYSIQGPGFDGSPYVRPVYLVWIAAGLAFAATLAPAALLPRPAMGRTLPGRRDLFVALGLGAATVLGTAAAYTILTPTSTFFWQKTAALGVGVFLASLVIGRGADRRTWALLVASFASISVAVSQAAGAPEYLRAAVFGAALVGIAGLRNVAWAGARHRLNTFRHPAPVKG